MAGTNVIEITVEGTNRQLVKVFADAIGASTASYVQELYEAYGLTALDPAIPPQSPVRPRAMLNLALGTALGLALGAGLAFLSEYLDTTLRTTQEIEAAVKLPTFAQIPVARRRRRGSSRSLNGDPGQTEAFLRLRTRILAQDQDRPLQILLVTSAGPGEGKSTVVAHLAVAMAHSGRKVVAVDADLRRPTLHLFFDLGNQQGLSDILEERASLKDNVQTTRVPGLRVLPGGRVPPARVVNLLSSPHMEALLQQLREEYDLVLLDTPAWLSVTDAAVLAPLVDGVLLVVGCAQVKETALRAVCQQLADIKVRVAGAVVNRVRRDGSYYYEYHAQSEPPRTSDPLTRISGIGPVYERALNRLGILTFRQLAKQNPEELAKRMGPQTGARRIIRNGWITQAQALRVRGTRDRPSVEEDGPELDE
jgi:non-specific protein-tyrosine kinase